MAVVSRNNEVIPHRTDDWKTTHAQTKWSKKTCILILSDTQKNPSTTHFETCLVKPLYLSTSSFSCFHVQKIAPGNAPLKEARCWWFKGRVFPLADTRFNGPQKHRGWLEFKNWIRPQRRSPQMVVKSKGSVPKMAETFRLRIYFINCPDYWLIRIYWLSISGWGVVF